MGFYLWGTLEELRSGKKEKFPPPASSKRMQYMVQLVMGFYFWGTLE